MRARRAGLGISLVVLAVWGSRWAAAQGSLNTAITPVYQSEGRDPVSFFVACATAPWTAVVSSDTIRRSLTMVMLQPRLVLQPLTCHRLTY